MHRIINRLPAALRAPAFIAALAVVALGSAFIGDAAFGQAPGSECAASTTNSVDGVPCVAVAARLWSKSAGEGVEPQMLLPGIDGAKLAPDTVPLSALAPMLYGAGADRHNRAIRIRIGTSEHPPAGTLALVRVPDRGDVKPGEAAFVSTVRTEGEPRAHSQAAITRGGSALTWGALTGVRWALFARTPDGWVHLD